MAPPDDDDLPRVLDALLAKLAQLDEVIVTDRDPDARSRAMKPVLAEIEAALASAGGAAAHGDRVARARALYDDALAHEDEQAHARRTSELALLAETLALREEAVEGRRSLKSVADAHLAALSARLVELAAEKPAAIALATRAERARAALAESAAPPPRAGTDGPSWAEVEGALTLWLESAWQERAVLVEPEAIVAVTGSEATVRIVAIGAWGAIARRVRVTLERGERGWAVKGVAVLP